MIPRISPKPGNPLIDRKHDMQTEEKKKYRKLKRKRKRKRKRRMKKRERERRSARRRSRESTCYECKKKNIYVCIYTYTHIYTWKKEKKLALHYLIFIVSRYIGLAEKKPIRRFTCNLEGFQKVCATDLDD